MAGARSYRARRRRCLAGPLWRGRGRGPAVAGGSPGLVAEQAAEPLLHRAAGASAGMDAAGLPAARAAAPEAGVRAGAGRAERLAGGAAADRPGLTAARASDPALLAGPAPGLAGGFGDHARGILPADSADQGLPRHAVRAQRAAGSPDADRPAAPAAGAGLLVGRVGDQAMGAQRPAVLVTDSDLLDGSAPRARLETGSGHAVAAAPLPADPPMQMDDPAAPRAWRSDDTPGAGVAQLADQPQHRRHGCPGAAAGEQPGFILQGPGEPTALPGLGGHCVHRAGHGLRRHRRIDRGDNPGDDGGGIPPVTWRALTTSRLPVPVAEGHRPGAAAGPAALTPRAADCAVPVLPAPLHGAQALAAPGAGRRRDHGGPCLAQRDQQVPDDPGRRGPAIGQDRRTLRERTGELTPLRPASRDTDHQILDCGPAQRRFHASHQGGSDADRVGQHVRDAGGHRSLTGPGDAGPLRPQPADPRVPAAGRAGLALSRNPAIRDR